MGDLVPFPRRNANDNHNPEPPQPGLKAFIVHEEVPDGCIAHLVLDNSSAPLLRAGDVVIVDTTDRVPVEEELYLIEWNCGSRSIVTCWFNRRTPPTSSWFGLFWVGHYFIQNDWADLLAYGRHQPVRFGDGPYSPSTLAEKFVGRIVGLLDAAYEEPRRLAA